MNHIRFEADEESHISNSDDEFSLLPRNDNFIDDSIEDDPPSFYRFANHTQGPA